MSSEQDFMSYEGYNKWLASVENIGCVFHLPTSWTFVGAVKDSVEFNLEVIEHYIFDIS